MFKKLSERIGFTQNEIKVIFFLLAVFIAGFLYKTFYQSGNKPVYRTYGYEIEDSLFQNAGTVQDSASKKDESSYRKIDYKQEVLGPDKKKFEPGAPKIIPGEKSINLNKAGTDELVNLPGIGKRTAEKIIQHRTLIGRFRKLEELLNVSGIGNSKFNKIKKFLYIE